MRCVTGVLLTECGLQNGEKLLASETLIAPHNGVVGRSRPSKDLACSGIIFVEHSHLLEASWQTTTRLLRSENLFHTQCEIIEVRMPNRMLVIPDDEPVRRVAIPQVLLDDTLQGTVRRALRWPFDVDIPQIRVRRV